MSTEMWEPSGEAGPPALADSSRTSAAHSDAVREDPAYAQAMRFMQLGSWREAGEALAVLERIHSGSPALREARELLRLHISAEETWSVTGGRAMPASLRLPAIRRLVLANLMLYLVLGALWVLGENAGVIR